MTGNRVFWHLLILALLLVSLMGPWTFDLINVPAKYACDMPVVRLYGDFCGFPMSGFQTVKWAAGGFFHILDELARGNFATRFPELVFLFGALVIVLPFFSNLLVAGKRDSDRLQIMNVIVWGMGCLPALTLFILQSSRDQFVRFYYLLWGLWLYILVAIGAMIFEIFVLRSDRKPGMAVE
jgi:hypothetical protein